MDFVQLSWFSLISGLAEKILLIPLLMVSLLVNLRTVTMIRRQYEWWPCIDWWSEAASDEILATEGDGCLVVGRISC